MFNTTFPEAPAGPESGAPFVVQLREQTSVTQGSVPGAEVLVTPALRTSGLLLSLAPEDLKNLVFLLTFIGPDGSCLPTVLELAEAMRVSAAKARSRMERLAAIQWQDGPLIVASGDGSVDAYEPGPQVLERLQTIDPFSGSAPPIADGSLTHEAYHVTDSPNSDRDGQSPELLGRRLQAVGLTRDQADLLVASYSREQIERQVNWLPYRNANNPPALLVAAIEGDYGEPLALRAGQPWGPEDVRSEE